MKPWRGLVALAVAATLLVPVTPASAAAAKPSLHPCRSSDDANALSGPDTRPARKQLPPTFTPVRAFICVDDQRILPRLGRWNVLVGRQLVGRLSELTAALRRPDEQPPGGPGFACPAILIIAPTIVVYSASGKAFRPRIPLNACGQPQEAVELAIAHLHKKTVQVLPRKRIESPAQVAVDQKAAKFGCSAEWSDLFTDGVPRLLNPGHPLTGYPATLSVCRYSPGSKGERFVAGRRLTKAETVALLAALSLPATSRGCARPHQGELVIQSRLGWAEAEIGGCSRVVRQDVGEESVGRADAAALARLTPS
jgi:hypothetical protein